MIEMTRIGFTPEEEKRKLRLIEKRVAAVEDALRILRQTVSDHNIGTDHLAEEARAIGEELAAIVRRRSLRR